MSGVLHICKRALYIRERALYVRKRALSIRKRALCICKRALYTLVLSSSFNNLIRRNLTSHVSSSTCTRKHNRRTLQIIAICKAHLPSHPTGKSPVSLKKSRVYLQKSPLHPSPVYPQKRAEYWDIQRLGLHRVRLHGDWCAHVGKST